MNNIVKVKVSHEVANGMRTIKIVELNKGFNARTVKGEILGKYTEIECLIGMVEIEENRGLSMALKSVVTGLKHSGNYSLLEIKEICLDLLIGYVQGITEEEIAVTMELGRMRKIGEVEGMKDVIMDIERCEKLIAELDNEIAEEVMEHIIGLGKELMK